MKRAIMIATAMAVSWSFAKAQALTPAALDPDLLSPLRPLPPLEELAAPVSLKIERLEESTFSPRLLEGGRRLQCVPFARRESGLNIFGDAIRWWEKARALFFPTSQAPSDGAVLVVRGYRNANRGHVAVVRKVLHARLILVDHANWLNRGEITRNVPVRDVSERGDWSQIKVWHVPGGHWGGRTYKVQGFILANGLERNGAAAVSEAS